MCGRRVPHRPDAVRRRVGARAGGRGSSARRAPRRRASESGAVPRPPLRGRTPNLRHCRGGAGPRTATPGGPTHAPGEPAASGTLAGARSTLSAALQRPLGAGPGRRPRPLGPGAREGRGSRAPCGQGGRGQGPHAPGLAAAAAPSGSDSGSDSGSPWLRRRREEESASSVEAVAAGSRPGFGAARLLPPGGS